MAVRGSDYWFATRRVRNHPRRRTRSRNQRRYRQHTMAASLTDIFGEYRDWYDVDYASELEKYQKYIAAGDKLCQKSGRKDVLALYGIAKLENYSPRSKLDEIPEAVVHIFRVEEIKAFDQVYGRNILFVSCYAP